MMENRLLRMTMRKKHILQHKKTHLKKETYTDRLKTIGKKVGFATIFTNTTRKGALPKKASIHTVKKTAIKMALKRSTNNRQYIQTLRVLYSL